MWSFGIPNSSIALIIIAILLFAEMNAIASLKLQSFRNNRSSTVNAECSPDIPRRRIKRQTDILVEPLIGYDGSRLIAPVVPASTFGVSGILGVAAGGIIGAGLGFGAGILAKALSDWKKKTRRPSCHIINYSGGYGFPYYIMSTRGGTNFWNRGNGYGRVPYYYYPPCYFHYCNFYYG